MSTSDQAGSTAPTPRTVERRTISVGGRQGRGDPLASSRVHSFRRFRVECDAAGTPFVWTGEAINEAAAISCAAHDLSVKFPMVHADEVRATTVIEVAA